MARQSKSRKWLKKKKSKWCSTYGRTSRQIQKYLKSHGKGSVPPPPS
jgi:hypothetical protein